MVKFMIICDTNILIEFYKNNDKIISELKDIGQPKLAISSITQAELYFGAFNKVELMKIKRHLSLIHTLPVDISISEKFIELMEYYSLSHKLSVPDALIAATALTHKAKLYTLNVKDFSFMTELNLYQTK